MKIIDTIAKDRIYNALAGLAVGDALGVPYEFKPRDYMDENPATDMKGYGVHNKPKGTWSDDTAMAVCLFNSLRECGRVDLGDIMNKICDWYRSENCFDIGHTCELAILNYTDGKDVYHCGLGEVCDNGNGALMRILPLAFYDFVTDEHIENVAGLTHEHEISTTACKIYVYSAESLIWGGITIDGICYTMRNNKYFGRLWDIARGKVQRDEIESSTYVVNTLESAFWCYFKYRNAQDFKSCLLEAVNLGGDTDTIAAITGGLCGTAGWYIPMDWLLKLQALPI